MPKAKANFTLNVNLLRPQSNPEKILIKLFRWLLSSGRYIFIFVEALVLVAFISRFKLDADLASKKEAIEEQIPYIESLRPYEILIRNTQLKLNTIDSLQKTAPDWPDTLKKIAAQIPVSIKIKSINLSKNLGNTVIHINGETQINSDITAFAANLKEDPSFSDINISNLGLEENSIQFTIDAVSKIGGQQLKL